MGIGWDMSRLQGKHVGLALLSVFNIVGNGCLIFTITRHKHLRTVTNVLITSLAVADFLFGFPAAPLYILAETLDGQVVGGDWLSRICLVAMSLTSFQVVITVAMVFVITLERYVCILHPLKHRKWWAEPFNVRLVIILLWLYASIFLLMPLAGWNALDHYNSDNNNNNNSNDSNSTENCTTFTKCSVLTIQTGQYIATVFYVNIVPACITMPILYARMFRAVRQFLVRKASNGLTHHSSRRSRHQDSHDIHREIVRRVSRRSLRLLVVILVNFLCSWLLIFIWYVVATRGFTITYMTSARIDHIPIPVVFYDVAANLGYAHSALNPYIYGLGNVRIRKAFIRMVKTRTCRTSLCRR